MGYSTDKNGEATSAFHTGEERSGGDTRRPNHPVATAAFSVFDARREVQNAERAIKDEIDKQFDRLRALKLRPEQMYIHNEKLEVIGEKPILVCMEVSILAAV